MRIATRAYALGVLGWMAGLASPADAQFALRPQPLQQSSAPASITPGELHGVIHDDKGQPLAGAVVSALGSTTLFAVSDREGRFAFRSLPAGPYLVRAHLQGFVPPRARVIAVNPGARQVSTLSLTRLATGADAPAVLAAGVTDSPAAEPEDKHEHGEVEWRLRHATRSVLKDTEQAVAGVVGDDSTFGDSFTGLGRAVGHSARLASALFADLSLTGQLNLLTTTSFERPQDLFSSFGARIPQGVAYVSLTAPGASGDWTLHGTVTQGDLSSWMVASSYARRRAPDSAHAYEAGVSYSTQRYLGGNPEALFAMRDGSRNAGAVYAYDKWSVAPRVDVGYGGRYARYDYLPDRSLISPRGTLVVQPLGRDPLRVRATMSHRETAPGEQEFLPPRSGLWLPPERTFSQISREVFRPERVDHVEFAAEREWVGVVVGVRAFRQRADDQVVTLFGVAVADAATVGHYRVGSAGDFDARGWGVSVSRSVTDRVRASVDYTQVDSSWYGRSPDAASLASLAASMLRSDNERLHDVTASVESVLAPSSTRLFVLYKMNTGFAGTDSRGAFASKARFNVQVNQALPFLRNWEMLVAVSNLFREDATDASVYDEVLVMNPPKRMLGGVSVRF